MPSRPSPGPCAAARRPPPGTSAGRLPLDWRRRSRWCAAGGPRCCRCPGSSLSVWSKSSCSDRLGTVVIGAVWGRRSGPWWRGELPRKSIMGVSERAGVTVNRPAGRITGRRVRPGRGMTPPGPGSAASRPGRHRYSPATISPCVCVTAARPRGHPLRWPGEAATRPPGSGRSCAKRLLACPAWAEPGA
jgi:hypothetical protein